MKSDLDQLMEDRNIDAFIILGSEHPDRDRDYITNGIHANATVIKKQGSDAVVIVNPMEVDEAKKSGLAVYTNHDFDFANILKEHGSDREAVMREYFRNILTKFDVSGRVAFYGTNSVMTTWKRLNRLQKDFEGLIEIVEDEDTTIFDVARRTKDANELEKLRESGRKTSIVLRATHEWLASHRAKGDTVVNGDGTPLTIGDVKRFVRLKLMELDMEDDEGMIFAQGRDAGVPHSRGETDQPLQVGQSIVFDLFPRPIGGGYYHDSTRTWCLGHASEEVMEAHRLVLHAHMQSLEALTMGQPTKDLQELVCDIFEEHGHPTPKSNPGTTEGYIHSLGHGLGLNVHEAPGISNYSRDDMVFEAGDVVTIEPGLYYPDRGWGIRIEDTVYLDKSGALHNLTDCTYDLVIPLSE